MSGARDPARPVRRSRRLLRTAAGLVFALVLGVVAFEAMTWLAVAQGWLDTPRPNRGDTGFWWGGHPTLGVWRHPDAEGELSGACFSVPYRTNSVGARDRERPRRADEPRVVVLGDSFLEGWGVEVEERLSDRLERRTGIPHLNFAMAHFSPYQELLAYREIAAGFDHDAVLASVLPVNDFIDSELALAESLPGYLYRYRPYLEGEAPPYVERVHREGALRRVLRQQSYAWNAVMARLEGLRSWPRPQRGHSWFYDVREPQMRRMEETLRRLAKEVDGRPLAVLLIPAAKDLRRWERSGPAPLVTRLERAGARDGYRVVDLLSALGRHPGSVESYYLPCDYHWSAVGHEAAEAVAWPALEDALYSRIR